MSGSWKNKERLVASWFDTVRNPLSGRNNVSDTGERREGDIVYDRAVVEVKRRKKNAAIFRAKSTREAGKRKGLPWFHIEFATGQPDMAMLVSDYDTIASIISLWRSNGKE